MPNTLRIKRRLSEVERLEKAKPPKHIQLFQARHVL
jgi:hypothetical protein